MSNHLLYCSNCVCRLLVNQVKFDDLKTDKIGNKLCPDCGCEMEEVEDE